MKNLQFEDLGLMRYKPCWDYQEELFKNVISQKLAKRDALTKVEKEASPSPTSRLIFVEPFGRKISARKGIFGPDKRRERGSGPVPEGWNMFWGLQVRKNIFGGLL